MLQMVSDPHVRTRRQLPFGGEIETGMYSMHERRDVAAKLLEVPVPARGVASVRKLQLTVYKATLDGAADRLRVNSERGLVASRLLDFDHLDSGSEDEGRTGRRRREGDDSDDADLAPRKFDRLRRRGPAPAREPVRDAVPEHGPAADVGGDENALDKLLDEAKGPPLLHRCFASCGDASRVGFQVFTRGGLVGILVVVAIWLLFPIMCLVPLPALI